jgi:hypothetical protein
MRRFLFIATLAWATLGAAAAQAKPKLAVLGIEALDDGDAASMQKTTANAKALTDALRTRAAQVPTYDLAVGGQRDLSELKLLADCFEETVDCMAGIGKEVGADVIIYGHLEKKKGGGYTITLKMLDVAAQREGKSVTRPFDATAGEDAFRAAAPGLFGELTGVAADAILIVQANVDTGAVYIDGAAKATLAAGTATVRGLPAGKVTVAIVADGYVRVEQTVDVVPGETRTVKLDLQPNPVIPKGPKDGGGEVRPGGTARILFWTSVGLTAAGAITFTITGLSKISYEDDQGAAIAAWQAADPEGYATVAPQPGESKTGCVEARKLSGTQRAAAQQLIDDCDKGESMAMLTNVFAGVTVVTALAAGYFYYKGYIAPKKGGKESATGKRSQPRVVVLPEVYPAGAGLGAVIQF